MTQENSLLGKFHLNEIPPMPRDVLKIDVTFNVDAGEILNASARGGSGVVSGRVNISVGGGVCLRAHCELVKHTLSPFSRAAIEIDSFFGAWISFSCCRKHSLRSRTWNDVKLHVSWYTGYKPDNASSGLKHWRNS